MNIMIKTVPYRYNTSKTFRISDFKFEPVESFNAQVLELISPARRL